MFNKKRPNSSDKSGNFSKKFKTEDDDDYEQSMFENDLAIMDEMDKEFESSPDMGEGPDQEDSSALWSRPVMKTINPATDSLAFQQLTIDNYIGEPIKGMSGAQTGSVPITRMFGITMEGNSVCCNVHGFSPYFYTTAP